MTTLREILQYEFWIIIHLYENSDTQFYPRKISQELGFPESSLNRKLKELENQKLVQERDLGPLKIYKLTDSGEKRAEELTKIPGIIDLYNYLMEEMQS